MNVFWYQLTRVVLDKWSLNGLLLSQTHLEVYFGHLSENPVIGGQHSTKPCHIIIDYISNAILYPKKFIQISLVEAFWMCSEMYTLHSLFYTDKIKNVRCTFHCAFRRPPPSWFMAALCNRAGHIYFHAVVSSSFFFFFFFSLPNLSSRRLD